MKKNKKFSTNFQKMVVFQKNFPFNIYRGVNKDNGFQSKKEVAL